MSENARKPSIRFAGFDDAWEQRKLGEITDVKTGPFGSTLHAGDYVNDGEPIITTEHFKSGELPDVKNGIPQVSEMDYIRLKTYQLKTGDIVFSRVGSVDINAHITSKQDGWLFSGRVLRVRPSTYISSDYLHHELSTERVRKNVILRAVGQTMPSINTEILKATQVVFPQKKKEQTEIGQLFNHLDNLITLHQRKYDKLVSVKKSMLEKMFPKNGSDIPEIRFAGFTDPWEQRKLSELATFLKGQGYSKSDLRETGTPIILYGRLYTKYETVISEVDTFVQAKDNSVYSQGGEVIVPASGETAEDISRASVVENEGIILGGDLNVLQLYPMIAPIFLALTISNGEQQKELSKRAQGKSVVHLHNSDLQEVKVAYPNLDEQKRIGAMFQNFDNLITLHQRKLEKLKNIKKSMLERMFV